MEETPPQFALDVGSGEDACSNLSGRCTLEELYSFCALLQEVKSNPLVHPLSRIHLTSRVTEAPSGEIPLLKRVLVVLRPSLVWQSCPNSDAVVDFP